MRLAVCLASRGLIHSRTIESIEKNIEDLNGAHEIKRFFTHNLPIPDAQNELVEKALKWKADCLFFVEEDNLIPKGVLKRMLLKNVDVVAVDYPVGEKKYSTICRKNGKILWCGLGCSLIKGEVFKKLKKPYFRTDKTFRIISKEPFEIIEENIPNKYGGHDIWFGMSLNRIGILIDQLPNVVAGHIKPKNSDKLQLNDDFYNFEIWDEILNYQNYN